MRGIHSFYYTEGTDEGKGSLGLVSLLSGGAFLSTIHPKNKTTPKAVAIACLIYSQFAAFAQLIKAVLWVTVDEALPTLTR